MKVATHNSFKNPQTVEATSVVITDNHGNPIAVAIEIDHDTIITATAEHPDFNFILRELGIGKTVMVKQAKQKPLSDVRFTGIRN